MAVLGIDIGGHSIKAGIVTKEGEVLFKEVISTEAEQGKEAVVNNIIKIAQDLLKKDPDVQSIGIGIPGIIDNQGYITYTPNVPLSKFNLGKVLRKKLKKKIVFGNDGNNFALAVHTFGAAKGHDVVIALTLGTGIGSGLIINGKLFYNKGAPELGHTTIKFDSFMPKCCNNPGCIESLIGRKSFPHGNPLEAYKKALAGDLNAINKFSEYGKFFGIALSNFIDIFNPDIIILGGELSNAYNLFKDNMYKEIRTRPLFKNSKIVVNKLKYAGVIGAAILAF